MLKFEGSLLNDVVGKNATKIISSYLLRTQSKITLHWPITQRKKIKKSFLAPTQEECYVKCHGSI